MMRERKFIARALLSWTDTLWAVPLLKENLNIWMQPKRPGATTKIAQQTILPWYGIWDTVKYPA